MAKLIGNQAQKTTLAVAQKKKKTMKPREVEGHNQNMNLTAIKTGDIKEISWADRTWRKTMVRGSLSLWEALAASTTQVNSIVMSLE